MQNEALQVPVKERYKNKEQYTIIRMIKRDVKTRVISTHTHIYIYGQMESKTSLVDELTRLLAGYHRNRFRFSRLQNAQTTSGAHLAPYSMSACGFSSGMKRLGHEPDHSPPPNTEVKNMWVYNSASHITSWRVQKQLYYGQIKKNTRRKAEPCEHLTKLPSKEPVL